MIMTMNTTPTLRPCEPRSLVTAPTVTSSASVCISTGRSLGVGRLVWDQEVLGSTPSYPTIQEAKQAVSMASYASRTHQLQTERNLLGADFQ